MQRNSVTAPHKTLASNVDLSLPFLSRERCTLSKLVSAVISTNNVPLHARTHTPKYPYMLSAYATCSHACHPCLYGSVGYLLQRHEKKLDRCLMYRSTGAECWMMWLFDGVVYALLAAPRDTSSAPARNLKSPRGRGQGWRRRLPRKKVRPGVAPEADRRGCARVLEDRYRSAVSMSAGSPRAVCSRKFWGRGNICCSHSGLMTHHRCYIIFI